MRVIVGCDGGGSKCKVRVEVLEDDATLVRSGVSVSGNANVRSDPDLALQNLKSAVTEALNNADVKENVRLDAMVGAFAGAGPREIQDQWTSILNEHFSPRHTRVIPDVVALFAAAEIRHYPVIACVVGTGSIVWARQASGAMTRAGGQGPSEGDEGSGHWIGRQALETRQRNKNSGELSNRATARFAQKSMEQLSVSEIASFSRDVFELAHMNELANRIIEEAAEAIATLLVRVASDFPSNDKEPLPWLIAGGIAVSQPEWIEQIRGRCVEQSVYLQCPQRVADPVGGAVQLAKELVFT